ncbi:MAG: leucine-rich repeat domain-containing protein, partial [Clostridia bacterium]|nr:leucine-rich repeat domain-containing protein [Clostridia bacterium]
MKERRWFLLLCVLFAALLAMPALADEGTLTLPADLKEIGEETFAGLSSASVVIVPEGVESIRPRSFAGSSLSEVRLPATLKKIGDGAFRDCGSADGTKRWYLMPAGIAVGEDAFGGCSARIYLDGVEPPYLTYTTSADSVTITGLSGDTTEVTIPKVIEGLPVTAIGNWAFKDQAQLTKLVIPEGVSRINSDAFSGCVNMTDITLPNTLKGIDTKAFLNVGQNATEPFYLVLPDAMEDIAGRNGGANTFEDFYGVLVCGKTSATAALLTDRNYVYTTPGEYDYRYRYESYTEGGKTGRRLWLVGYEGEGATADIPAGIYGIKRYSSNTTYANWRTFHGNGFYGRESLTKAVIPEGTKVIEDSAFLGCVNLTDVTFPDSLRVLKNHAFEMCGSASAGNYYYFLPDNVEEI